MSDIQTLLVNRIRNTLDQLSKDGVGYIDYEQTGLLYYHIDGREFEIAVNEQEKDWERELQNE